VVKFKTLIVGCSLVIISGCAKQIVTPAIIMIGDCEHGIVSESNIENVKKIWPEAQRTDVLIAGGCYQDHFIRKGIK